MGSKTFSTSLLAVLLTFSLLPAWGRTLEPKEYDRLDGHGATTRKVDVIEWENNLEIHVYPKGSLRSLGMKIDRTKKEKPVMVIEYGFSNVNYTLIRRALLSIPMKDGFKTYRDPSAADYDKIIISNNTLMEGVETFTLAPAPTQLYPDYHPSLAQDNAAPAKSYQRKSASENPDAVTPHTAVNPPRIQFRSADEVDQNSQGTTRKRRVEPSTIDADGGIKNFEF